MLSIFAFVTLAFQACQGVTVTQQPANSAVEIGQNVTIACMVTNKGVSENVQWKMRANGTSTFNAITFNENVLGDATKYAVVSTYNLTVINAATADEGTYRCTAGTLDYDAQLTVVDLPNAVAIAWGGSPDAGNTVNLTCTATNGRPTPNIRWIINGVDMSASGILETNSVTASGYGNSVSNLPLVLNSNMNGNLATCYVAYDGWDDAMNATYILNINGGASLQMSGLIMSAIVVILAVM
ncbi:V-set and immunoglobulin domain-containing protein 1-like [Ruditapes philippinarum]|uniref:V-set and immunoglobulin domain-containing protein 1-like n=1 Tax=Ruditapes philippinarum TaxID=129788 RepID=UPI00295ADDC2|nr:V-set and immunoglobulin domain-containing protein 1-like [Ruditapes philippinarum]